MSTTTTESNAISTTNGQTDDSISAIDKAVAAQQARKAAKAGKAGSAEGSADAAGDAPKRKIYTPEERLARAQQLEAERAERKQARQQESAAKREQAQANRGTPHMSKVEKAAAGLAPMDAETQALFDEVKGSLGGAQIDILVAHLAFHSRRSATEGSLAVKLDKGMRVRIVSGPAKLIGKEGTVEKAQRIHVYVDIGANKPAYLFNRNVEVIEAAAPAAEPEAPSAPEATGSDEPAAPAAGEQAA